VHVCSGGDSSAASSVTGVTNAGPKTPFLWALIPRRCSNLGGCCFADPILRGRRPRLESVSAKAQTEYQIWWGGGSLPRVFVAAAVLGIIIEQSIYIRTLGFVGFGRQLDSYNWESHLSYLFLTHYTVRKHALWQQDRGSRWVTWHYQEIPTPRLKYLSTEVHEIGAEAPIIWLEILSFWNQDGGDSRRNWSLHRIDEETQSSHSFAVVFSQHTFCLGLLNLHFCPATTNK